jgi:hypothetical protein
MKLLHVEAPDRTTALRQHANLSMQPVDVNWANYMEQMLHSYFFRHGPQVGVEVANIACRTTTCEIQAFSNTDARVFSDLLTAANKETWWDFTSTQVRSGPYQNREGIFAFLERPSPALRATSPVER